MRGSGRERPKPIQQRQLVFDQLLLLTREERPCHRYLTVAAGAAR